MSLLIRLGDANTAYYEKPAVAIQELSGYSGQVDFAVPVLDVPNDPQSVLLGSPAVSPPANLSFLLDGRLGLSTGGTTYTTLNYRIVENPQFELSSLILDVNAVAVPEPCSAMLCVLTAASAGIIFRGWRGSSRRRTNVDG